MFLPHKVMEARQLEELKVSCHPPLLENQCVVLAILLA